MRLHEDDEPFQRSLAYVEQAVTVIDVGANIGVWSLLAARRNPAATIHAFEPVPGIAAQLQYHARLNHAQGIRVNACAVAAENGRQRFFAVKEGNIGASSFYEPCGGVAVDVPVTTLDTYVASAGVGRVDMIKIDAEGSEFLVLEGARRLRGADEGPLIFFELNEELCAHCGVTGADVKSRLVELGYGIYRWDGAAFAPVPIEQRHRHEDLFAFKARHQAGKCLGGNERARIMDGA
jgi:FkbM family methyltransferase